MDPSAKSGESVALLERLQGNSHLKPPSMRLIATVRATAVSKSSTITPRRSPGPWFLAGAPSKLSVRPLPTSTRPPGCDYCQRFERAKSSAGLGAYPPYCPHGFCAGACPHRVSHIVVGERFGAPRNVVLPRFFLAHHIGRPLGRSVIAWGCLRAHFGCTHEAKKFRV